MTTAQLLDHVESHDFAASINVASSSRSAIDALLASPTLLELRDALGKPDTAYEVLTRVFELTRRSVDVRYENPNDIALFAYVFTLNEQYPALALIAAAAICQVPNLWWAATFASEIIDNRTARNMSAGETLSEIVWVADVVDRIFVADTRWLFSPRTRLAEFFVAMTPEYADVVLLDMSAPEWRDEAGDTGDLPLSVS